MQTGAIAAYEIRGREVTLYWRGMGKNGVIDVSIDAVAAIPGKYSGEASAAYLYYTDEAKSWAQGLFVDIAPLE